MPILKSMFPEHVAPQINWNPQSADRVLLAGDETSIDTIALILSSLPARSRGQVFIEVDSAVQIQDLAAPGRFSVCWLLRERGQSVARSVAAWLSEMLPVSAFGESSVYAWVADEGPARLLSSN